MADVLWLGGVQPRPQLDTVTVTAAAVGSAYALAVAGKSATYTAVAGDTTATIAAGLAAALAAAADGELLELTAAASAATVLVFGPADGAPFALTLAVTGTGTATLATTTLPKSPSDVGDGGNYSTGALPAAGDRLVVEGAGSLLYNLDALAGVAVSLSRRSGHAGTVGLPDDAAGGYREYRKTHIETQGLAHSVEVGRGDDAGAVRLRGTGVGASLTIVGDGPPSAGDEPVDLSGGTGWAVSVSGAGVALAVPSGHAVGLATLQALNSSVAVGAGASVSGAATLTDSVAVVAGSLATLSLDRGGSVAVVRSGSVSGSLTVDAGEVSWRSTANPPACAVGSGGTLSFEAAPAAVSPGVITLSEGATLSDPAGRLVKPYDVVLNRTEVGRVSLDFGTNFKLTVGA